MTNLSKDVRRQLRDQYKLLNLKRVGEVKTEDTTKFLLELPDGRRVESVLMWDGRRRTLCVSSQVGCPLDCQFCATGRMGLIRNLTAGEIVDQIIHARRYLREQGEDVTNVVMMGMGEPLLNRDLPEIVRPHASEASAWGVYPALVRAEDDRQGGGGVAALWARLKPLFLNTYY